MKLEFETFIKDGDLRSYHEVRELLAADPRYQPYSSELRRLNDLCAARKCEEMRALMPAMLPNLLLSPSFHLFAGIVARELEDDRTADLEAAVARRCLEALLATGDGSEARPFHIMRVEDEYDVMAARGMEVEDQEPVERDGRYFDVLRDGQGGETWFDVTVPRTYLDRAAG